VGGVNRPVLFFSFFIHSLSFLFVVTGWLFVGCWLVILLVICFVQLLISPVFNRNNAEFVSWLDGYSAG
jgi:hypothetical protein